MPGEVDRAHAAPAHFAHDTVGADAAARHRVFTGPFERRVQRVPGGEARDGDRGRFDEVAGLLVLMDERLDLLAQSVVARARRRDEAAARVLGEVERGLKNFFNLLPAFGGHKSREP